MRARAAAPGGPSLSPFGMVGPYPAPVSTKHGVATVQGFVQALGGQHGQRPAAGGFACRVVERLQDAVRHAAVLDFH